ncbi:MAG: hypothetical protein V3T08_10035 [Gemmatimonadota bacterium]
MRTLRFLNPEIQDGLNLTVRNGDKWADARCGDILQVVKTGEEDIELAQVMVVGAVLTNDVPNEAEYLLKYEHDPSCRTMERLHEVLDEAYPNGWGPNLTLLFFVPLAESQ